MMLRKCKIPLFGRCWRPDDLESGLSGCRVADEPPGDTMPDSKPTDCGSFSPRRFKWTEIESLTGGLAASAIIGEGGSATVYLARLPAGRSRSFSLAAVKIHRPSERLHWAFRQELDVLLRVRHPHVVSLLGFSDDSEEGALVFEHVSNGSLHEKLHRVGTAGNTLPWARRMTITYRLAQALEYLHEGCNPQIVHGDIKSSNVLIDEQLSPKLCDFGSARVGFSAAIQPPPPSSFAARSAARMMMGSPGYVDPHYLRSGMLSKKSDVYSYGVLLLELITGEQAFDSERDQKMLVGAARPMLGDIIGGDWKAVKEFVDKDLNGDFDPGEAAAAVEVAAMCTSENPGLRPSMSEVVRILGDKLLSSISAVISKSNGRS